VPIQEARERVVCRSATPHRQGLGDGRLMLICQEEATIEYNSPMSCWSGSFNTEFCERVLGRGGNSRRWMNTSKRSSRRRRKGSRRKVSCLCVSTHWECTDSYTSYNTGIHFATREEEDRAMLWVCEVPIRRVMQYRMAILVTDIMLRKVIWDDRNSIRTEVEQCIPVAAGVALVRRSFRWLSKLEWTRVNTHTP